ncbi:MAG: glycerophosphodiester phosphodiesterase [Inquilinus sp.]|nr:glycerophosphodiester phosphodiesterase [Inquilinus sp.]
MTQRLPFLDHPLPHAFAHRGGGEEAAENTLEAFEHAIGLGYRYLETDVHATADGVLVAFHDRTLDRLTGRPGRVADLTAAELRSVRIDGRYRIPLLADLLGTWPEARINIDPKTDEAAALLPEALRRAAAIDRVCVGSFSGRRLARLRRRLGPGLCTSMGPADVTRLWLAAKGLPAGRFDAACAQVSPTHRGLTIVAPRFLAAAHRRNLPVHVWTINEAAEMHRLLDLGVDGLMSDRPTLLKRVLRERGQWTGG